MRSSNIKLLNAMYIWDKNTKKVRESEPVSYKVKRGARRPLKTTNLKPTMKKNYLGK